MMKKNSLRVTDHAVLRYMERAMGLDVEQIRERIQGLCADAAAAGAVCVKAEGLYFQISSKVVLTVTPGNGNGVTFTRDRKAVMRGRQLAAKERNGTAV